MWGPLAETHRVVERGSQAHHAIARRKLKMHSVFGLPAVLSSAAIAYIAIDKFTHPLANGIVLGLSVIAGLLSALTTFYSFKETANAHITYAIQCHIIKKDIEFFFEKYPHKPTEGSEQFQKCFDEQQEIERRFDEAQSAAASILIEEPVASARRAARTEARSVHP